MEWKKRYESHPPVNRQDFRAGMMEWKSRANRVDMVNWIKNYGEPCLSASSAGIVATLIVMGKPAYF